MPKLHRKPRIEKPAKKKIDTELKADKVKAVVPFIIDEPFYTIEDTATILHVKQITVYSYINRDKLLAVKIGRDYIVTQSAIEDLSRRRDKAAKNHMIKRAERKLRRR